MIEIRKSKDRGFFDHGWLKTFHTFSFGEYHDPKFMSWGALRVINEDRVAAEQGFGTHPHRDMEIMTYIVSGALQHKDSMGNGSVIKPGDVQRMTAGTGVTHSEFNPFDKEVHLLQIWIIPARTGLEPSYEQKHIESNVDANGLTLLASADGRQNSVRIHQDVLIYSAKPQAGKEIHLSTSAERKVWLQVVSGDLDVSTVTGNSHLSAGDGAGVKNETSLKIKATSPAEMLIFDLGS